MAKQSFFCIDAHTCGNPVRVVTNGNPPLKGLSMGEMRQHFLRDYDWIRKALMFEPRGHDMMSGSFLYPPCHAENDVAILYIETSGCLPMCGHGTIGTVTIAIEEGLVKPEVPGKLRLETPAGLVLVDYQQIGDKVTSVKLTNVPSFLAATNITALHETLGELVVDVAYGGNFYAIVDPQKNFSGIQDYKAEQLIGFSRSLRTQLNIEHNFIHPENTAIKGLSHILWTGDTISPIANARNAVFYGDKAIDRSPCGTGTSARMAQWHAKGLLAVDDVFVHESFIGSQFKGRIEAETCLADKPAIIPSIEGWAKVYGYNHIIVDDDDPYCHGFQVI